MKSANGLLICLFLMSFSCCFAAAPKGVIFVMTDDTGYGDMTYYDNIYPDGAVSASTPNLDSFAECAVRLSDFHVGTTCSPSRGALISGRNFNASGVWHTIAARELMREDEQTIADAFQANDWETGLFGKWHLGDSYPFGPRFRGFDVVRKHNVGGIGQFGDFWRNDYYSGVDESNSPTTPDIFYDENDLPVASEKFCTDFWFDEAKKFIADCISADKPFFCYVPLNAAHGPVNEPYGYSNGFDGLVENIDDNMGWLDAHLDSLGVKDDVLVIFTTDNGTASGRLGGLRGKKSSNYDGGHRVPCLWRWKSGGIGGTVAAGRDEDSLIMIYDVFPTLMDICEITRPASTYPLDGISVKDRILDNSLPTVDRVEVVDTQRVDFLTYRRNMSVMKDEVDGGGTIIHKWRLTGSNELYDVMGDRDQSANIAGANPSVVSELLDEYDDWWNELNKDGAYAPFVFDPDHEAESTITVHQCIGGPQWQQSQVNNAGNASGVWEVRFARPGTYRVELRRWPREVGGAISGTKPDGGGTAISSASKVRLQIENIFDQTKDIGAADEACVFSVPITSNDLNSGRLTASLLNSSGVKAGTPYLLYVTNEIAPIPDQIKIESLDSVSDIASGGVLLDAVNFGGNDVTVNGVDFKGYRQDTGDDFTTSFLSTRVDKISTNTDFYTGSVSQLDGLLDSIAWDDDDEGVLTIRGLIPGKYYAAQLFLSDNRSGQDGRYVVVQGDGLAEQSIYGGPSSDPVVISYSFTAIAGFQTLNIESYHASGAGAGPHINAFQLRQVTKGDYTIDGKVDLKDVAELSSAWLIDGGYGLSDLEDVVRNWLNGAN